MINIICEKCKEKYTLESAIEKHKEKKDFKCKKCGHVVIPIKNYLDTSGNLVHM